MNDAQSLMRRHKMVKCCCELSAKSSSYLSKLNSTFVDLAQLMLSVRVTMQQAKSMNCDILDEWEIILGPEEQIPGEQGQHKRKCVC